MKKRLMWLLPVLLIAAVTLYSVLTPSQVIGLAVTADGFTVTVPDGTSCKVTFSALTRLELIEKPDFGVSIDGQAEKQTTWGLWESAAWGRYRRTTTERSKIAILAVQENGEALVFSYQNTNDTRLVYEQLLKMWRGE